MRAILAVMLLLVFGVASSNPDAKKPIQYSHASQQEAKADQRGTDLLPLTVNIKSIPERTQEEKNEIATERKEKSESDWWLVKLTGALVIATAALVAVTAFLWKATIKLVKGAEETAQRQLRAYLHVSSAGCWVSNDGCQRWAKVEIKNFGQTPAYDVEQWIGIVGVSKGDTPNIKDVEKDFKKSRGTIGPSSFTEFHIPLLDTMTSEKEKALNEGRAVIYVFGKIIYRDVFNMKHFTKYKLFMTGEAVKRGRFSDCEDGNEST